MLVYVESRSLVQLLLVAVKMFVCSKDVVSKVPMVVMYSLTHSRAACYSWTLDCSVVQQWEAEMQVVEGEGS